MVNKIQIFKEPFCTLLIETFPSYNCDFQQMLRVFITTMVSIGLWTINVLLEILL